MEKNNFLAQIGKAFIPKRFRPDLRIYLAKAGIPEVPYTFFGILFYVSIGITALIYLLSEFYSTISDVNVLVTGIYVFLFWVIVSLLVVSVIMGGIYFYLNMKIYKRVKIIEDLLPDFLTIVSTNLKGGLSFEKALWSAIKPEFTILSDEMSIVSKKVMTGQDLSDSLIELGQKYDSPSLKRTVDIIIGEVKSGGKVAYVLDDVITNLRKTKMIKEEMAANTLMFTIFIGAIVIVISPLLFALSKILLEILIDVSAKVAPALSKASTSNLGGSIPFKLEEITVSTDDFRTFSVLALGIISFFASLILSIVQKGEIKAGIKYIPFFVVSSIVMYFIFSTFLGGAFAM